MDLFDSQKAIAADIAKERLQTVITASGFLIGLQLSVGYPLYLFLHHENALLPFLCATFVAPALVALAQTHFRDLGWRWVAEFTGYIGTGLGLPVAFLYAGAAPPALFLQSTYMDVGRFRLVNLLRWTCGPTALSPAYMKNALDLINSVCMVHAGKFQAAVAIDEQVLQRLEDAYEKQPTPHNWEGLCVMAPTVIWHHLLTGNKTRANAIWSSLKTVADTGVDSTKTSAYPYQELSQCAVRMKDYQRALHYADLGKEHFDKARMTSKSTSGSLSASRAQAHFFLGNIDEAEKCAKHSLSEISFFANETAAVNADAHYVLGKVAMSRNDLENAQISFDLCASIHRARHGHLYAGILPCLDAYAECLRKIGRRHDAEMIEQESKEIRLYHNIVDDRLTSVAPAENAEECESESTTEESRHSQKPDKELAVADIAKLAAMKQGHALVTNLALYGFLAAILGSGALAKPSFLIIVCGFAGLVAVQSFYKKLYAKHLSNVLDQARCGAAKLELHKEGIFPKLYCATVKEGSSGIPTATRLRFDIAAPAVGFDGKTVNCKVFFKSSDNKPLVVATKNDAFTVDNRLITKFPPLVQGVLGVTGALVLPIGVFFCIMATDFGVPSKKVPDGKTASEYYTMGLRYKTAGWTEQSRDALQRAIKLGNGNETAREAERFLITKLPRYPQPEDAVHMNIIGFNADGMFTHDAAEKAWRECIKKYPNFEWPYSNLGSQLVERGRLKEGDELLLKAIEINPNYVNALNHLGDSKRKQRDFKAAHQYYERVLKLDPGDEHAQIMNKLPDL